MLNLKEIAGEWCGECNVAAGLKCYHNKGETGKCFDRLLRLLQTIAMQEIAEKLNDSINVWTKDADKENK